jgi:cytochrome b6-f complex iron-sulfur subunit
VRIGSCSQLSSDPGALYSNPSDAQPAIIIRHSDGWLNAVSAICTHRGCQVGYHGGGHIQRPCHGGLHDASAGTGEGGPPPAPLPPRLALEHGGTIYAMPA